MGRKRKRSSRPSRQAVVPNSSYYRVSSWDFEPSLPGTSTATTISRHTDLEQQLRADSLFLLRGDVLLDEEDSRRPKRSRPAGPSMPTNGRRSPQPGTSQDTSVPGTSSVSHNLEQQVRADPFFFLRGNAGFSMPTNGRRSPQPGTSRDLDAPSEQQERARLPSPPVREIPAVRDDEETPLTLITDFPADLGDGLPDNFFVAHMGPPYIEFEFNLVEEEVTIWEMHNTRPLNVPYNLPTMIVNPENAGSDCRICLGNYEEGEELSILPCEHKFHSNCVNAWLRHNPSCPMCRAPVD